MAIPQTNLPEHASRPEELASWLALQYGVVDRQSDVVNSFLMREVLRNHDSLLSGLRQIQVRGWLRLPTFCLWPCPLILPWQDVDMNLSRAAIHVNNCRRRLAAARECLMEVRRRSSESPALLCTPDDGDTGLLRGAWRLFRNGAGRSV